MYCFIVLYLQYTKTNKMHNLKAIEIINLIKSELNGAEYGFNDKCIYGLHAGYYEVQISRGLEEMPWFIRLEKDVDNRWYVVSKNAPEEIFINALKNK